MNSGDTKPRLLSQLIKAELAKMNKRSQWLRLKDFVDRFYIPSLPSFLTLVLIFLVVYFVTFFAFDSPKILVEENQYQNFIAIHAGIGTVIFALIIFVAEGMRDGDPDQSRVLLKESFLFPLTVAEILGFFYFVGVDATFWSIVPTVAIGLASIFSISQVIRIQLNRYLYKQKRIEMLKGRFKQSITIAIRERIGKNLLHKKLNANDIKLEFSFFPHDEGYVAIKSDKYGIVQDIDLSKLEEFAHLLDIEAQQNGFSFSPTEAREHEIANGIPKSARPKLLVPNSDRFLSKNFGESVSESSNILLEFDSSLVPDVRRQRRLVRLGRSAFVIKKGETFTEEMQYDVASLKDQFISAVERNAIGEVETLANVYVNIAEGFSELLHEYGVVYSFQDATKERQTPFSSWKQIDWLTSAIRPALRLALETKNIDLISKVAYVPVAISRRALQKKDHFLFQEFIWFPELLYDAAQEEPEGKLRAYLIDRSWRFVNEIASIYVESKLSKENILDEELTSLRDFAVYILIRLQSLLKQALDAGDIESFNLFAAVADNLYRRVIRDDGSNSEFTRLQLEREGIDDVRRTQLEELLAKQVRRENLAKELQGRKLQMFFWLSSWTLHLLSKKKDDEVLKAFFDASRKHLPVTVPELTDVFMQSHKPATEDFWNWDRWELIPDGVVRNIDIFGKLERFYAVQTVVLLAGLNLEVIQELRLPPSRDLTSLAEGNSGLVSALNNMHNNPKDWAYVLDQSATLKTQDLQRLLQDAKARQDEIETERIRITPISTDKVEAFKNKFPMEFYRTADMRAIFDYWKSLHPQLTALPDQQIGISILDDKASFFDEWFVHYLDWGESYGKSFSQEEDKRLVAEIEAFCQVEKKDKLDSTLEQYAKKRDLLVLVINNSFTLISNQYEKFVPEWQNDSNLEVKGFAGWYKTGARRIPVIEVFTGTQESKIIVLEQGNFGSINQYSPSGNGDRRGTTTDIFSIFIAAFSDDENLRSEFLRNPPDWLQEYGSVENQDNYLRARVLVEIFEAFQYVPPKDPFGYVFPVETLN